MIVNAIKVLLYNEYCPSFLEVNDNTSNHISHANNTGLHLYIKIKSDRLELDDLLAAHRDIYQTIGNKYMSQIHALQIDVL